MQRLFTTFADGWPGFGLLVQRLVTGIVLLQSGIALFKETTAVATSILQAMAAVVGLFIMIGLWTPLAGALIAGIEIWIALLHPENPRAVIVSAVLGATLAIIGPGAFSVDARLFGRKHIGT